ncbi:MAG: FHA domain-containing protein [Kiritimatiellae bacterium]|nr:FHA domain-containing protein [Kiritimatiellia bacterium]
MMISYKTKDGTDKKIRLKTIAHVKPITIGRSGDADITLDDTNCSRIHAAIRYWDDIFIIRDMGSSNGTLVNGKKIEVAKINPGDIAKVGATEFSFSQEEDSASDVTIQA